MCEVVVRNQGSGGWIVEVFEGLRPAQLVCKVEVRQDKNLQERGRLPMRWFGAGIEGKDKEDKGEKRMEWKSRRERKKRRASRWRIGDG